MARVKLYRYKNEINDTIEYCWLCEQCAAYVGERELKKGSCPGCQERITAVKITGPQNELIFI